jgi:signal transduction histidine kinase/ActR/RegA family two-component response regulator/HAMP domain-containing protein
MRGQTIRLEHKLKLITMLASGAALLVACIGIVTHEFFSYRRALTQEVTSLANLVSGYSALALSMDFKKEGSEYLSALASHPNITAACIFDKRGTEFARYVRKDRLSHFAPPAPKPSGHEFVGDHLSLFAPIVLDREGIGTIYIESDLVALNARLRGYAITVLLLMAAALGFAFVLSNKLQKLVSRPLLRLAETARLVSEERNYSVRAPKSSDDELGALVDGFNQMLAQIEDRDDALRHARDELEHRVNERTCELQQEVIERKQAETMAQQQLARISLLNQITNAVSERQNVDSILSVVLEQLEQHLSLCCGAFYLFQSESKILTLATFRARPGGTCPFAREITVDAVCDAGLNKTVRGEAAYLPDSCDASALLMLTREFRSVMIVPLTVESKLFGWLVAGRGAANAFSPGEADFLRMLSAQVALAGYHAQLYTQLQQAYNELRQTQNAAMQHERLRALGQLASGIAHDINNALSPVMGYADLLLSPRYKFPGEVERYLQHIRVCSQDIAHIVSRLREFYRQREEKHELVSFDANGLVEQVVALTRPRWRDMSQQRGISVAVTSELAAALPQINGIESELREALTNLILNAVDALPQGGTIVVRTRISGSVPQAKDQPPPEVIIEVVDTGIGMDEDVRKRCLEPFFSTKGVRGTGLGLAMVYGIMERHDGRIEIDSVPGEGTTMRLVFPVTQRETALAPALPGVPLETAPLRILFVDDEPLLRQVVNDMLAGEGHEVTVVESGEQALAQFRAARATVSPFDVVITDLGMPGIDGRKLASSLKIEAPQTPVIMLTGWGDLMRQEGDIPTTVDALLSKPPRLHELRDALRKSRRQKCVAVVASAEPSLASAAA